MNQRDARKLATRRALSNAAIRLFAERGYDDTRAGDIAAAAGVTERTFFHHFPTKDRSVFPDHDERVDAMRRSLAEVPIDADPFATVIEHVAIGIRSTVSSDVRARRYRLINTFEPLRHRDLINDLDYEAAFTEFLIERWPVTAPAPPEQVEFRARAWAATAIAVARAALTTWAATPAFNPERHCVESLGALVPWP